MVGQVVTTQLIIDSSGAKQGERDFIASMEKIKQAAIDAGGITGSSFDSALRKWQQSLGATDPVIRAQIQKQDALAKQQAINNKVVDLGAVSADAARAQMARLAAQHDQNIQKIKEQTGQLTTGQAAWLGMRNAMSGVSGQLVALSAGAGPVGVFLSAIPGWGVAAAVGIGVLESAFTLASAGAHDLAQKAEELRRFSEATGLSTDAVQALRSEAAKFGVTSDEAQTAIQNFTARFNELRLGQGELLTQIRRVSPALADQMATTHDAAKALTLFGQALLGVDDIFQRNALVKAALGRGGLANAQFLTGLNVDQVTQGFVNAGKALDEGLIKRLVQLQIDIDRTTSAAKKNFESIFAEDVLAAEKRWVDFFLQISDIAKNFKLSDDLGALMNFIKGVGAGALSFLTLENPLADNTPRRVTGPEILAPLGTAPNGVRTGVDSQAAPTPQFQLESYKQIAQFLGAGITPAEQLKLKMLELASAVDENKKLLPYLARAQADVNEQFRVNEIRANVSALGAAATAAEQYRAHVGELQLQLDTGKISQDTFNRAVADFKSQQSVEALQRNVSALGEAATDTEKYSAQVAGLQLQLQRGQITQDTFNRAVQAADPVFKQVTSSADTFFNTLAQGLLNGKSLTDSLKASFDSLASSLASSAVKDAIMALATDNPALGVKAAVEGVTAIGSKLLGGLFDDSAAKQLQEAQKAWAAMSDELAEFVQVVQAAEQASASKKESRSPRPANENAPAASTKKERAA